ncbi:MAG TPA: DapH/DapD/GlmU-related protein [Candidatus Paceibacterota bacterium]|nr:DapH/DapD/GlmU-related protein [Candidatus Paceibacterota bacterium]
MITVVAIFFLRLQRKLFSPIRRAFWYSYVRASGVRIGRGLVLYGRPTISRARESIIQLGDQATLCSDSYYNDIGVNHEVILRTKTTSAAIIIGNNFGMSGGALCARERITIGDNVMLGANVTISDNDSHPLGAVLRRQGSKDMIVKPVVIGNDVWIGADSYVGKGVSIGDNVVIGAKSVVTKSIPANCIAAGVPCRIIRQLD